MKPQDNKRISISVWHIAKIFWLAQGLASLTFGLPLVAMTLFAAKVAPLVIWQTVVFYLAVSLFIFVPFHGVLSYAFLRSVRVILNKNHGEGQVITKERLRAAEWLFNAPLYFSAIIFVTSLFGFVFGLFLLWLGAIPNLMSLIGVIIVLGLAIGFVTCLIQSSLIYVFLESYCRSKIELFNRFYPDMVEKIKIRKFSIFWKFFLTALSSIVVAQVSLGTLYLGRIAIYSREELGDALIYVGVVLATSLFYVVVIALLSSRNLIDSIKKIISWSDKIIKGKTEEEIFLTTNDEATDLIEYLKRMYRELEEARASLEIRIKARTKELEDLAGRQEEIIESRTKEIQERVEELEKFRRLSVGRELKMVTLKEEIGKLKEELEKYRPAQVSKSKTSADKGRRG
jgi:hypothetical protein